MAASSALDDLLVIDLSSSVAGAWCSRLLADFGADVVLVEPTEGSPLRGLAPLAAGPRGGDDVSVLASYVLANKRSLALDLELEGSREALARLAARADVVVESGPPRSLEAYGVGLERRAER